MKNSLGNLAARDVSQLAAIVTNRLKHIWRVLTDADAEAFDAAVGTWLMNLAGFTRRPRPAAIPVRRTARGR
jgi:hypothetical protein